MPNQTTDEGSRRSNRLISARFPSRRLDQHVDKDSLEWEFDKAVRLLEDVGSEERVDVAVDGFDVAADAAINSVACPSPN